MPVEGVRTERRGAVGWIILKDYQATQEAAKEDPEGFVHHAVGTSRALEEFRWDPEIRVVVLTGENDGEFYRVSRDTHYEDQHNRDRLNPLKRSWGSGRGVPHPMELLGSIEKPVIARMNGDAIGLGQAFIWGCDIIVARDDAIIADVHTGMQEVVDSDGEIRGFPWAVTPGDGAMSYAPLYMPPTKLKEYMFLSRVWTTKQLAEMNIINYAVPADELDDVLDEIVQKLLKRPASVLARTKRVINKRMIENWNLHQDLASAYEYLDFFEHAKSGEMD